MFYYFGVQRYKKKINNAVFGEIKFIFTLKLSAALLIFNWK